MPNFVASGIPMSQNDFHTAAAKAGGTIESLWAVVKVETSGCGYLPDRRPQILFERHKFHKFTNGRFDASHPGISAAKAGGYGKQGAAQYDRLAEALALDEEAALKSASWGIGQIMGYNCTTAGYAHVHDMVSAFVESEQNQIIAMGTFIANNGMSQDLANLDWASFASKYNGSDYKQNNYDTKLATNHDIFVAHGVPDLKIRTAQLILTYLGYKPGAVDGLLGDNTKTALQKYQIAKALPATMRPDDATLAALHAEPFTP
jgi:cellobiose phosphorylase